MINKDDIHWQPLNIANEARRGRNFLIGGGLVLFVIGVVMGIVLEIVVGFAV